MSDDGQKVTPKPGDRVRITYEGEVTQSAGGSIALKGLPTGAMYLNLAGASSLEVIEPEYEVGAMYVTPEGDFFAYWPEESPNFPWFEPGGKYGNSSGAVAK